MTGGLPDPLAVDAVVVNDIATRTLVVKPAKAGSYAGLLWREGHRKLMQADQGGRTYHDQINGNYARDVWASGAGRREIARGKPAADGSLRFKFERGDPSYMALVSTPWLGAIVVVDRASSQILGVKFS